MVGRLPGPGFVDLAGCRDGRRPGRPVAGTGVQPVLVAVVLVPAVALAPWHRQPRSVKRREVLLGHRPEKEASMPLVMKVVEDRCCPVVVCDYCQGEIDDALNGNYQWRSEQAERSYARVYFTHKECC